MGYGIFRFLIEFIRADDRGKFIGNISPSQFWSIIMVGLSIVIYFLIKKNTRKLNQKNNI